jgi:hypothetical protein
MIRLHGTDIALEPSLDGKESAAAFKAVVLSLLDQWLSQMDGLLTFGREGLIAHDNTHHALYMAYCTVDCLEGNGRFDRERWQSFRGIFETHVVED